MGRAMMGHGVIELRRLRQAVEATGYNGPIEVEIFNEEIWKSADIDLLERDPAAIPRTSSVSQPRPINVAARECTHRLAHWPNQSCRLTHNDIDRADPERLHHASSW